MLNNKLLIHPFLGETGDTFCLFTKMLDHIFLIKNKVLSLFLISPLQSPQQNQLFAIGFCIGLPWWRRW